MTQSDGLGDLRLTGWPQISEHKDTHFLWMRNRNSMKFKIATLRTSHVKWHLHIPNLTVLAGKLHNVTFGVITRNITRLIKTPISH